MVSGTLTEWPVSEVRQIGKHAKHRNQSVGTGKAAYQRKQRVGILSLYIAEALHGKEGRMCFCVDPESKQTFVQCKDNFASNWKSPTITN